MFPHLGGEAERKQHPLQTGMSVSFAYHTLSFDSEPYSGVCTRQPRSPIWTAVSGPPAS